jgi:hypothetical protein
MTKNTTDWKFDLGDRVKDRVTELEGIITTRTEHLNGCKQYGINPPVDKDGKMREGYNIDGEQLDLVDEGLNKRPIVKKRTGGAMTPIKPSTL